MLLALATGSLIDIDQPDLLSYLIGANWVLRYLCNNEAANE